MPLSSPRQTLAGADARHLAHTRRSHPAASLRALLLAACTVLACGLWTSAPAQQTTAQRAEAQQAPQPSPAPELLEPPGPPSPRTRQGTPPGVRRRAAVRPRPGILRDTRRAPAERLTLTLFDDVQVVVRRERAAVLDDEGVYWTGRPEGPTDGVASFVMRRGSLAGHVHAYGRTFLIQQQADGSHAVDEVDPAEQARCGGGRLPSEGAAPLAGAMDGPAAAALPQTRSAAAESGPVIDLLVVYTAAARSGAGGPTGIRTSIDLAVAQTNEALANSLVPGTVRLLDAREVAYPESQSMNTDLDRLTHRFDGFMDDVHAWRDEVGADAVALITEENDQGWAGLAWVMTDVQSSFAAYAFSVIQRRSLTSYTLAHELGHNLGLTHDRANANLAGAFAYAYGYRDPPFFRDVMSYACPAAPCPQIAHFSNPQVFYQGRPTGGANEDAARSLRQTLPVAAQFRPGPPPALTSISPASGPTLSGTRVTLAGTGLTSVSRAWFGAYEATGLTYLSPTALSVLPPPHPQGPVTVRVEDDQGRVAVLPSSFLFVPSQADADGDALPDDWEVAMGLRPDDATGINGASGDPSGNGLTNFEAWRTGRHPRPLHTRYFAEGASTGLFATRIALLNPHATPVGAVLRFLRPDKTVGATWLAVPARTRRTIDLATVAGMSDTAFSTVIESDRPLVADRTMTWDRATGYGAHAETSIAAASPIWYLAEGATHSGFSLFYLLQNPAETRATVRVRYLRPDAPPLEKLYSLPPSSRTDIWVNRELFEGLGTALAATDVSAVIESINGTPIIVERAMYLSGQGRQLNAGHASAGVTAPSTQWFLAEGATGPYFDLFVLIANPNPTDAEVTITYLLFGGTTYTRSFVAKANSRSNVWVDMEQIPGVPGYPLADVALSTTVTSTNGIPIIVERSMWWPGSFATWHEAHNSAGSTAAGTRWALAEGEVGGARRAETYILIANTSPFDGNATVTLLFEDGSSLVQSVPLQANSRTNVAASDFGAAVQNRRFSVIVESTGATPAQIVVERAMYSDAEGVGWAAGTNAVGTRLP